MWLTLMMFQVLIKVIYELEYALNEMPYYGSRRNYKSRRKRRFYRKNNSLAGKAYALAKRVSRDYRPEIKFFDTSADLADCWTTPSVVSVSAIPQGDGEQQRIGEKVTVKSIQMKWDMVLTLSDATTAGGRIVLVQEKSPLGVAPAWLDVFEEADVNSLRNMTSAVNWKVLYDRTISMSNVSDGTDKYVRRNKMFKKVYIPVEWNDVATAPLRNGIYLMFMSTQGQTAGDLTYRVRLRFTNP